MPHTLMRIVVIAAGSAALSAIVFVVLAQWWVGRQERALIFSDAEQTPPRSVALVLGTTPFGGGGGVNPFFSERIGAAARLYHAGRVKRLLVSGNGWYGEPAAMTRALAAAGVPQAAIDADERGHRTFYSVLRAAENFGARNLIIVSQRFHVARALFIARCLGLDAIGFAAGDPDDASLRRAADIREILARSRAVLDCWSARFAGRRFSE